MSLDSIRRLVTYSPTPECRMALPRSEALEKQLSYMMRRMITMFARSHKPGLAPPSSGPARCATHTTPRQSAGGVAHDVIMLGSARAYSQSGVNRNDKRCTRTSNHGPRVANPKAVDSARYHRDLVESSIASSEQVVEQVVKVCRSSLEADMRSRT